jgi:hypothetical protein
MKRRAPLGKKLYRVLLASTRGDAIVEVAAHNADAAKRAAKIEYSKDGWLVMAARAR